MEKKESGGIIRIIGWYIIAFSVIKFLLVNWAEPKTDIIAANLLSALLLICGIGILFLNKYARLIVVTYFAANGIISIGNYCYGFAETLLNYNKPLADPAGYTNKDAIIWISVMIAGVIIFYSLPVIVLASRDVRKQFK